MELNLKNMVYFSYGLFSKFFEQITMTQSYWKIYIQVIVNTSVNIYLHAQLKVDEQDLSGLLK